MYTPVIGVNNSSI